MSGAVLSPYLISQDPGRVPDGEGGFTKSRAAINATIYMQVSYHENLPRAHVRRESTIKVKDFVEIDGAVYEVTDIRTSTGSPMKEVRFKRSDRPISTQVN